MAGKETALQTWFGKNVESGPALEHRLDRLVESQEKKLSNQQFVSRAPADVVEREREKLTSWHEQRGVLAKKKEMLGC